MARPRLSETSDTIRMQLPIQSELVALIDEYRYRERIASRSEAVRLLVSIALVLSQKPKVPA